MNPNKYNWNQNSRQCHIAGCDNTFNRTRKSGLCNTHVLHTADLLLEVRKTGTDFGNPPAHFDILDKLLEWATTRHIHLETYVNRIAIKILGNIPDITILDGQHKNHLPTPLSIQDLVNTCVMPEIEALFSQSEQSWSSQTYTIRGTAYPVRILFIIFAGLMLCEESNRGDRWLYKHVLNMEDKVSQLGGAMPLTYLASRRYDWPITIGPNLLRKAFK